MEGVKQTVSLKKRLPLSLKKNKTPNKTKITNPDSDIIVLDESFDRLRSDFYKDNLLPQKVYSPIVIDDSCELSHEKSLVEDKHSCDSGNVSLNISGCVSTSYTKSMDSSTHGTFPVTPCIQTVPSKVTNILNESRQHCSMEKLTPSHRKLLADIYGNIFKSFPNVQPPNASKKLIFDDDNDADKENIQSIIKKNKELYLTDSEIKQISENVESTEKKSKKKLFTERIASPPVVSRPRVHVARDVQTTVKKKNKKDMPASQLVQQVIGSVYQTYNIDISSQNKQYFDMKVDVARNKTVKVSDSTKKLPHIASGKQQDNAISLKPSRSNETKKGKDIDCLTKTFKDLDVCRTPDMKRLSFMASLAENVPHWRCHPEALQYHDAFKTLREQLTRRLYSEFNRAVFGDKLDKNMVITWESKLRSTAGTTTNRLIKKKTGEKFRLSSIKLSCKVLDRPQRVRDTLVHELCHAATWQLDGDIRAGHGPLWTKWCDVALRVFPELGKIARCHQMDIHYKFTFECTRCRSSLKRHTKSIDVTKQCCRNCGGDFEVILNTKKKDGVVVSTPARSRSANGFALFVQENYGALKPGRDHAEVMKLLSQQYRARKMAKNGDSNDDTND